MADPLSITAAAVGITAFALSGIETLHSFIQSYSGADAEITATASNLEIIQTTLRALAPLLDGTANLDVSDKAKADLEKYGVATAVNSCGEACVSFQKDIENWTKHSGEGKLSKRDRLSVGVLHKEQVRTHRTMVGKCQQGVQFAAQSVQLACQLRSEQTSVSERAQARAQMVTLEETITEHVEKIAAQTTELDQRLAMLQSSPAERDEEAHQRQVIAEVQKQCRFLEADQITSGIVFASVHQERTGLKIGNVTTAKSARVWAGLPESVVNGINAVIGDVKTEEGAKVMVGVAPAGMRLDNFFD